MMEESEAVRNIQLAFASFDKLMAEEMATNEITDEEAERIIAAMEADPLAADTLAALKRIAAKLADEENPNES